MSESTYAGYTVAQLRSACHAVDLKDIPSRYYVLRDGVPRLLDRLGAMAAELERLRELTRTAESLETIAAYVRADSEHNAGETASFGFCYEAGMWHADAIWWPHDGPIQEHEARAESLPEALASLAAMLLPRHETAPRPADMPAIVRSREE